MSREAMWDRVRMAWSLLSGRTEHDVRPGRPRETRPAPESDAGAIAAEGFAEEALPWLDAVYRFSMRLTRGDRDATEDLVQDTFLRAHRFWHLFERGTNVRSWLFTICRNVYLHGRQSARSKREYAAADVNTRAEALAALSSLGAPRSDPEQEFFERLIDERVIAAIDALPDEFHEVLVLSDLGDLRYAEIAQILEVPVGTVKSRLFRARRLLQERLREFALEAGYVQETT